jgi:glycosyltransferase involved in cell wall biosynthesis
MKILITSTYYTNQYGGASVAAYRLHRGLQSIGIDSMMLVQSRQNDGSNVFGVPGTLARLAGRFRLPMRMDTRWPLRLLGKNPYVAWDIGWLPSTVPAQIARINPDVIHLHWIGHGFMSVQSLTQLKRPLVWTLHDSWAFTGGCHLPYSCLRYYEACGACPQLNSDHDYDLSRWIWNQKQKYWNGLNLTIVTPSRWLADCAKASSLLQKVPVNVIPYGLDLTRFKPLDKKLARKALNLPQDSNLILFGAIKSTSDPNKGFRYLLTALQELDAAGWKERAELLIFGSSVGLEAHGLDLKAHSLGYFSDEVSLALLYSAADVFVAPSIQDNFPNTVLEALACGTPCVAFNIGGMPDMIEHQNTGYLAHPYEADDLARGIAWVLEDYHRWQTLSYQARAKVEKEFSSEVVARRYANLYESVSHINRE